MADTRFGLQDDPRIHMRIIPEEDSNEGGDEVRKATLGGDASDGLSAQGLYAASEFCLVLPGHIYDLGRRAYDVIARACIPVIVAMFPMFVTVPFASQLPWTEFAVFATVKDEEDAARMLRQLVESATDENGRAAIAKRRAALREHAPSLFLPPHSRCPEGSLTAMDSILQEIGARQVSWAALRSVRAPDWPAHGLISI